MATKKKTSQFELEEDILIQLGSPAQRVELDETQIEYAIGAAERWGIEQDLSLAATDRAKVRNYAVAMATMVLGRVRLKYNGEFTCDGKPVPMDGESLLRDARLRFEVLGCGPYG